jgi:hypothetical protein
MVKKKKIKRITKKQPKKKKIKRVTRSKLRKSKFHLVVFYRDDFTCRICGEKDVNLNAHHLIPWAQERRTRADLDNMVTVCVKCHLEKCHKGSFYDLDKDLAGRLLLENLEKSDILTVKKRDIYVSFFKRFNLAGIIKSLMLISPKEKEK